MKSIIVGTSGHIDHGKTTLVRALTGIDEDRVPRETAPLGSSLRQKDYPRATAVLYQLAKVSSGPRVCWWRLLGGRTITYRNFQRVGRVPARATDDNHVLIINRQLAGPFGSIVIIAGARQRFFLAVEINLEDGILFSGGNLNRHRLASLSAYVITVAIAANYRAVDRRRRSAPSKADLLFHSLRKG